MTDHMQVLRDDIRAHELTGNGSMDRAYAMRWAVAEIERLNDGIDAIRQYGSDTLRGPTNRVEDTRDWQREAVLEMTSRAVRVLNGDPWLKEPTDE